MIRATHCELAVLIALSLTTVAIGQNATESPATAAAADVSPDLGRLGDGDGPHWDATADALFLQRSAPSHQQLLYDPGSGSEVFNASNLDFSTAAGPRLSLRRDDPTGLGVELTYFGIDGWKVNREVTAVGMPSGTANLILDDQIIVPVTDAQFTYQSRFYNAEANLRLSYCDWFRPLIGFRWVELNDRYQVTVPAAAGGSFTEAVRANNHLYGLQIGADARIFDQGRFRLEAIAKTGIFCDDENQQTDVWAPASPTASAGASCNHIAYLSEVGLMFSVAVTDHLRLRAGYQAIFLESVALAPMQLPATDLGGGTARVDMSGNLLYHGATAGLELTW